MVVTVIGKTPLSLRSIRQTPTRKSGAASMSCRFGRSGEMGDDRRMPTLQRVIEELPATLAALREEARAEGYRFVERLVTDWESGTIRFDRQGEALLAARLHCVLAGIGGLTFHPVVPDALRMRRFYVRPAYRRSGV